MMKLRNSRAFWLGLGLLAVVLVACGPAGGGGTSPLEEPPTPQASTPVLSPAETPELPATENNANDPAGTESVTASTLEEQGTGDDAPVATGAAGSGETSTEEATVTQEPEAEETIPGRTAIDEGTAANGIEGEILTEDDRYDLLRQVSETWTTNWNRHTVPYDEILIGQLRDRIASIDDPEFISQDEAAEWLADNEPVQVFELNGDARAYPLQILTFHEIVNDVVGDKPVVITFCPLCNSALVFDRTLDGAVYEFGTSGLLRFSDLIMYDRTTESLWQQFTGDAIVGDLVGYQLTFLPSSIVSFADFRTAFPDGAVLSRETGYERPYGANPYVGYDTLDDPPLFRGTPDDRLPAMERVVSVSFDTVDVAYPVTLLSEQGVINDSQGGYDLVVFHTPGTSSALNARNIANSVDVGATGVFDPNLNGQKLTFRKDGEVIKDDQTNSTWNILGQAVDGPLAGEFLQPIIHGDYFWFSWAAFRPDTVIFGQD